MNILRHRLLIPAVVAAGAALAACTAPSAAVPAPAPTAAAPTAAAPTAQENLLPLPQFAPCSSRQHPMLPAKWEAVGLLQDFVENMLWFGKFVYDESAQAFRSTILDQSGGGEDLLSTQSGALYRLQGGEQPTSCALLTTRTPYTVPPRDWLPGNAECVGVAPILARPQQWWKAPDDTPGSVGTNWIWYDVGNGLPFRSMYYAIAKPQKPVPIYEYYTFNYFPTFKPVPATNLAAIVKLCEGKRAAPAAVAEYATPSIAPLARTSKFPKIDPQAVAQIERWIPGFTTPSPAGALPPPWPRQVQGTVFMTAVNRTADPFPTRVFYDWTKTAQNTTLYTYPPSVENYAQTALLTGDTGYIFFSKQDGTVTACHQALPGPQVPNWKEVDGCQVRAQIAPRTVLNPSPVPTKILWCPTDLSAQQVFWTWYSEQGTPVVFMQTNSSPTDGTGLNLADYYEWAPGSVAPHRTFDVPPECTGPITQVPEACHNCHLPLNSSHAAAAKALGPP